MNVVVQRAYDLIDDFYGDDDDWDGVLTSSQAEDIAAEIVLEYGSEVLPLTPEDIQMWWHDWRDYSPHIDWVAVNRAREYDVPVIRNLSDKEMRIFARSMPRYYQNNVDFQALPEPLKDRILSARTL